MTRIKKSRKDGLIGKPKSTQPRKQTSSPKEAKVRKGLKAGLRYSQDTKSTSGEAQEIVKNPKIGSKKPIDLKPAPVAPIITPVNKTPQAKLATPKKQADQSQAWLAELDSIEQDDQLQLLLDKVDEGKKLTANEQALLNKKMARHAWLIDKLGIEIQDEDDALLEAWENNDFDEDDYE